MPLSRMQLILRYATMEIYAGQDQIAIWPANHQVPQWVLDYKYDDATWYCFVPRRIWYIAKDLPFLNEGTWFAPLTLHICDVGCKHPTNGKEIRAGKMYVGCH